MNGLYTQPQTSKTVYKERRGRWVVHFACSCALVVCPCFHPSNQYSIVHVPAGISDKSSEILSAENPELLSSLKMVRTKLQMNPQLTGIYYSIIVLKILNFSESINKQIFVVVVVVVVLS